MQFRSLIILLFLSIPCPIPSSIAQNSPSESSEDSKRLPLSQTDILFSSKGRTLDKPTNDRIAQSEILTAELGSKRVQYRAFIKNTRIEDDHDIYPPADIMSFSYEVVTSDPERPVIFLFNGGPGSSSIWLHMSAFGPQKTSVNLEAIATDRPSFDLEDNPGFLIDVADLVFVDALGTGLSRVAEDGSEKAFQDLRVDARAMCRLAENWLAAEGRTEAPVYLVGVSYSAMRVTGMASHPKCRKLRRSTQGLILISGLLDLRQRNRQSPLQFVGRLPTYAALAWYHGHVDRSDWASLETYLDATEHMADRLIGPSVLNEHLLTQEEANELHRQVYTHLGLKTVSRPQREIRKWLGQIPKSIVIGQGMCVYDARFQCARNAILHPDLSLKELGDHLESELIKQFERTSNYTLNQDGYTVIRDHQFRINWDYRFAKSSEMGAGTNMAEILERTVNRVKFDLRASLQTILNMSTSQQPSSLPKPQDTRINIMVASGRHDLITPYYAMEAALIRAGFKPSELKFHWYDGGHMMYLHKETGHQLAADIRSFVLNGP